MKPCRRCSDCVGMSHHWTPDPMPYSDESWAPGDYACKHCLVRGNDCCQCDGTGDSRARAELTETGDPPADFVPCDFCKGEGVIPLTEEEFAHEYQLRAGGM